MKAEQRDYKQDYEDYWKDVVENDIGELNKDQVMRELSDYSILISSMSIILDHVTSGRISKPLTLPEIVCQVADESYDEGFSDERDEYEETIKSLDDSCASLRSQLAAMTAERDRLRETIEKCLGKAHHLSQLGVDPATRISIAGEIINICMKSLESEAPND